MIHKNNKSKCAWNFLLIRGLSKGHGDKNLKKTLCKNHHLNLTLKKPMVM